MKSKTLIALVVVAVGLLLLAHFSGSRRRQTAPSERVGKALLESLDLNQVHAIDIEKEGETLRVQRKDETWVVTDAFDYPADFARLRRNLIDLQSMRIGHVQRNLQPEPDAEITQIRLHDPHGQTLAALRITPQAGGQGFRRGNYIFLDDNPDGFLVTESLHAFAPRPRDWLETEILNLAATDIRDMDMLAPDGTQTRFRQRDGVLRMEDLAENETFDTARDHGLKSAFSYLRFAEVADPSLDDTVTGIATGHVFRVTTGDGIAYTARIGIAATDQNNQRYARFRAETVPLPVDTTEEDNGVEPDAEHPQQQRVHDFNQRHGDWIYRLHSYSTENMIRPRQDWIAVPEPDTTEDEDREEMAPQSAADPEQTTDAEAE